MSRPRCCRKLVNRAGRRIESCGLGELRGAEGATHGELRHRRHEGPFDPVGGVPQGMDEPRAPVEPGDQLNLESVVELVDELPEAGPLSESESAPVR